MLTWVLFLEYWKMLLHPWMDPRDSWKEDIHLYSEPKEEMASITCTIIQERCSDDGQGNPGTDMNTDLRELKVKRNEGRRLYICGHSKSRSLVTTLLSDNLLDRWRVWRNSRLFNKLILKCKNEANGRFLWNKSSMFLACYLIISSLIIMIYVTSHNSDWKAA